MSEYRPSEEDVVVPSTLKNSIPKFRKSNSTISDNQNPSSSFAMPSFVPSATDMGFVSLRRSTRSTTTTPVKTEPNEPISTPTISPNTPRKRVKIEHDTSPSTPRSRRVKAEPMDSETLIALPENVKPSPSAKGTPKKPSTPKKTMPLPPLLKAHPAPARWEEQYALIERMRRGLIAPVDTMGCERPDLGPVPLPSVATPTDPPTLPTTPISSSTHPEPPLPSPSIERTLPALVRRFHVLISLMLSSQTKDTVTSAAVTSLHLTLPGGLTPESLAGAERGVVEGCINKVGFWRRKAEYIQETATRLLADNLDIDEDGDGVKVENGEWQRGDIPKTIEGLCKLKGVGPKMAYLALQCAWDINAGIGVDVHVHRITNRLKWHKPPTITPEQTRVNLESWLPSHLHKGINPMLVGFGQTVCQPVGPRCDICLLGIKRICPSRVAGVKAEGRKPVEYTYTLDVGDGGDIEDMISVPKQEELAEMVDIKEGILEEIVKEEI